MEEKKNILIIDDDVTIRNLARKILEDENYNIFEAENGKNALEIIKYQDFDMIFCDIMMPVMDGITFLSKLQEIRKDIPVAVLTMVDSVECTIGAMKFGAFAFCTKPINVKEIKRIAQKGIELKKSFTDKISIKPFMAYSIIFKIPSNKSYLNGILDEIVKLLRDNHLNEDFTAMIKNAINEAVLNAIIHGNQEDNTKMVIIKFELSFELIKVLVIDSGNGFDHKTRISTCINDVNMINDETGKGIFIMTCNMDEVLYNHKGNIVRMIKKINPSN